MPFETSVVSGRCIMSVVFIIQCILYFLLIIFAAILALKLWLGRFKAKCKCTVTLEDKVILITGGDSGIGLETAKDLARRGATIIIASENAKKCEVAVKEIIETTGNNNVHFKSLDLAKFSSIKKFAAEFKQTYDRLNILVNNAGCAGIQPVSTEDGIEIVTQVNYVGPFLLTNLLKDKIVASKPSRIVIVASKAHEYHEFDPNDIEGKRYLGTNKLWKVYANSKLCTILWAKALAKRLPDGVTVNALHPGVVKTEIYNKGPKIISALLLWAIGTFFKTAEEGAQTTIRLCVDPGLESVSGEYFEDCKIASPDKSVRDEKLVEKVWVKTVQMTK